MCRLCLPLSLKTLRVNVRRSCWTDIKTSGSKSWMRSQRCVISEYTCKHTRTVHRQNTHTHTYACMYNVHTCGCVYVSLMTIYTHLDHGHKQYKKTPSILYAVCVYTGSVCVCVRGRERESYFLVYVYCIKQTFQSSFQHMGTTLLSLSLI